MNKLDLLISNYLKGEIVLLTLLEEIVKLKGFLSIETFEYLSKKIDIPVAKLYSVASFYSFLPTAKKGRHIIHVCNNPSCYLNGSEKIIKMLEKELGIKLGETTTDGKFSLELTSCIGCCDLGPAMLVDEKAYVHLDEKKIKEVIKKLR